MLGFPALVFWRLTLGRFLFCRLVYPQQAVKGRSLTWLETLEDKRLAKRGAEIKATIEESLRFSYMPEFMQAAWVRKHGRLPGDVKERAKPTAGLEPELARELVALSRSGVVEVVGRPNDETAGEPNLWRVIARVTATAKG